MNAPARKTSSQAMQACREKYDSVEEHTLPQIRNLHASIDAAAKRARERPSPIPREEPPSDPPPSNLPPSARPNPISKVKSKSEPDT